MGTNGQILYKKDRIPEVIASISPVSSVLPFGLVDASPYMDYELPITFILAGLVVCGVTTFITVFDSANAAVRRIPKWLRSFAVFLFAFACIVVLSDAKVIAMAIGFFSGAIVVVIVKLISIVTSE